MLDAALKKDITGAMLAFSDVIFASEYDKKYLKSLEYDLIAVGGSMIEDESYLCEDFISFFPELGDGHSFTGGDSGVVLSFKDSVVTISGLDEVQANELIYFEGGASGIALNLEYSIVKALVFGGANSVRTAEVVTRSNVVMRVGVGRLVLGRIVNPLGYAMDGYGSIDFSMFSPIEEKAPGVITREKINQPVETGLKIVDSLVPIGRGQRELILGDRKTGKTTIAIDAILNQAQSRRKLRDVVTCIYVAVGKRMAEIVRIFNLLNRRGAMDYTALVVARASDPASLQFIAPYSACAMAEYFTYAGEHSLIVYDDLTRHADAYRQISLLLRRPVGREAYPGDIFYLHSRLLERAVKLCAIYGNGTLTALPIVETIQGDVSAYIPTNVISITDGQIYLDLDRHQEGVRPAVDPGLSVSRVGSSAQSRLMKRLSGSLKLELAQFREVEQFSKFGSELDPTTRAMLTRGRTMIKLLRQNRNAPISFYQQIVILHVATTNLFRGNIAVNPMVDVDDYFRSLFGFFELASLFMPMHVVLELHPAVQAELFDRLLEAHFFCYFSEQLYTFALPEEGLLYDPLYCGHYNAAVDAGLRLLRFCNFAERCS